MSKHRYKSQWRTKRYRELRAELIELLGGICPVCGCGNFDSLEFHHITPRTWKAARVDRLTRIKLYFRDAETGAIELRCCECHERGVIP
jgi:hypothetical protein